VLQNQDNQKIGKFQKQNFAPGISVSMSNPNNDLAAKTLFCQVLELKRL